MPPSPATPTDRSIDPHPPDPPSGAERRALCQHARNILLELGYAPEQIVVVIDGCAVESAAAVDPVAAAPAGGEVSLARPPAAPAAATP